ncbi:hypothetical protein LD39_14680 [Halobacillus sp. BBL2006]|nr:hypothetical protein LD39_14680 [Halobacillus sp. BBL2006]
MSKNANQPMFCENGRFILVFNGEIYNFHSLKDTLVVRGHEFQSHTDRNVMEVAGDLHPSLRANQQDTKYALRQAAKSVLPEEWANRPKVGFPVPIRHWLRQEKYYLHVKELFLSETAAQFFHTEELLRYLNEHYESRKNHHRYIWTVYVFLTWYDVYFVKDGDLPEKNKPKEIDQTLVYA